jgi:hypothetical protein
MNTMKTLKNRKFLPSIFWLLLIVIPFNTGQTSDTKESVQETHQFTFNREIAIKFAVIALEELNANSLIKTNLTDFNTNRPVLNSILSEDCCRTKRKVILVCFPAMEKKGYAFVHLILNKDGYLSIHRRGYSNQPIEELVDEVKTGIIWFCGH